MNTNERRDYLSTQLPDGKTDVSSDGRTVWVNRGTCIARFCPLSHEYVSVTVEDSSDGTAYPEMTIRNDSGSIKSHWEYFVRTVKGRWGIEITPEHTPLYVLNEGKEIK